MYFSPIYSLAGESDVLLTEEEALRMRHRTRGLIALATGLGLFSFAGTARAQSYFDYYTTYNSGTSGDILSSSPSPLNTVDLPGPPNDETHSFFTVSPLQNLSGTATSSNINLLSLAPQKGTSMLFDTTPVKINQNFSLKLTQYQSDANGTRLGNDSSMTLNGTWQGVLTNNSDTVMVLPSAAQKANSLPMNSGGVNYSISVNPFVSPGFLGGIGSLGILSATVDSEDFVVPEPGSLALFVGAAVPGALLALRLRRKRRA
jgi:hypothetical protein